MSLAVSKDFFVSERPLSRQSVGDGKPSGTYPKATLQFIASHLERCHEFCWRMSSETIDGCMLARSSSL